MPRMISKVAHIYAGRTLSAGDPFDADQEYVATLIAIGRAELAPTQQYQTRDMVASAPAADEPRQKRKYNTKRKAA